jgi:hypothetical protein
MKNYWLNRKIEREMPKIAMWDFYTALSNTIKEKYAPLYVKVVEVSNVINRKILRGTPPKVAASLEAAGFTPAA